MAYLAFGPEAMDPIRIVKGMFIFSQEAPADWLGGIRLYSFEPYNWGPYSFELNRDLDHLQRSGLLEVIERSGVSWEYRRATPAGHTTADELAPKYDPRLLAFLKEIRQYTLRQSFKSLLRAVYKKYPEYAVNSVFQY